MHEPTRLRVLCRQLADLLQRAPLQTARSAHQAMPQHAARPRQLPWLSSMILPASITPPVCSAPVMAGLNLDNDDASCWAWL